MKVKGYRLHVRRKLKENEENRGLIDKKAYEKPFVTFVSSILELSHYSLSLTLGHLEFTWITFTLDQVRQRRQEEGRSKQGRARSSNYNMILIGINLHVCFPC